MKKILLISDTHSHIDDSIIKHVKVADEVWHAGDIGAITVADTIQKLKPFRAVHGNIDDAQVRISFPEHLFFTCDGLRVLITHIAGKPGKFIPSAKKLIQQYRPELFICGHSHILNISRNASPPFLHMNPGAIGIYGFHATRTMIRFEINLGKIQNVEVIEIERTKQST
jgi:uncharacterized protein